METEAQIQLKVCVTVEKEQWHHKNRMKQFVVSHIVLKFKVQRQTLEFGC